MDKGTQPQKQLGVLEKFKLGIIDAFTVPVNLKKEDHKKRGYYKDHSRSGISQQRWLKHNEMLMHHKRIKRRRRRNEIAKQSRRLNYANSKTG